jgi:hypothetical protein
MAGRYVLTARRKAALRKAQLVSARRRRKGARRANKINKYGASARTATLKQRRNREARTSRRIVGAYVALNAAPVLYNAGYLRHANSKIAYNGEFTNKKGQRFNQQGGARFLHVKPTARGVRRRNRADFVKQHGVSALASAYVGMKRTQRAQRKTVRNAVRHGSTTMTWGARSTQTALPRGRR